MLDYKCAGLTFKVLRGDQITMILLLEAFDLGATVVQTRLVFTSASHNHKYRLLNLRP